MFLNSLTLRHFTPILGSMKEQLVLQKILRNRLEDLKSKNTSYSLRAFSKRTGLSPTTLSLVLNGRRKVSKKIIQKICERLTLDPLERSAFTQFNRSLASQDEVDFSYLQLTADQFHVASDWHCYAILSLIKITGFKNDTKWIAARLGSTESKAKDALERLKRLELVEETSKGQLKRTRMNSKTTDDVANASLRKAHEQTLELARRSIEKDSIEHRDLSSLTFPMNKNKMEKAKSLIRKFQLELMQTLQEEGPADEVYRLAVQLFPLTQIEPTDSNENQK